ncbi:hypothetical protein [Massilia sp. S19_KUP03_FR1]
MQVTRRSPTAGQAGKAKLVDKYIDHPDLVVFVDMVVQSLGSIVD